MSGTMSMPEKGRQSAFSRFKRGFASAMALVMNRNFLFFCAAIVLVALAACGKGDDGGEKAADTGKGPSVRQAAAPAEPAPAKKGPNLVETLRENSGVMTPEEKAAAVARARANAESAARAVGQGDAEAQSAAEAAAGAAQKSLDERQPQ